MLKSLEAARKEKLHRRAARGARAPVGERRSAIRCCEEYAARTAGPVHRVAGGAGAAARAERRRARWSAPPGRSASAAGSTPPMSAPIRVSRPSARLRRRRDETAEWLIAACKAYGLSALVFALDRLTKWIIETRVSVFDTHPRHPRLLRHRAFAESRRGVRHLQRFHVAVAHAGADRLSLAAVIWSSASCSGRPARLGPPDRSWGLALILGGAVGNLFDRIVWGRSPTSWISTSAIYHWPTFNVADSAIVIGSGLLLLDLLRPKRQAAKLISLQTLPHRQFLASTYGVLVALAFLVALWLIGRLARSARGSNPGSGD